LTPSRSKNLSSDERDRLEQIAREMFSLNLLFWAMRRRNRVEDPYELTEPEFVVLDTLAERGICTVGELQQILDVRPAQMSRIIRTLESKAEKPLINCAINAQDKRRINVTVTDLGRKAHEEYRRRRLQANIDLLTGLSEAEQMEVIRLLHRFRQLMSEQIRVGPPAKA